jgi:hypothetical protein
MHFGYLSYKLYAFYPTIFDYRATFLPAGTINIHLSGSYHILNLDFNYRMRKSGSTERFFVGQHGYRQSFAPWYRTTIVLR